MTFSSFLDRLVRRIPLVKRLESENQQFKTYFDNTNEHLHNLANRIKEIEEAEYQTEADVANAFDEFDPWNDPSFTGSADEWLAAKFSFDKSDGSGPSPRRRPSH